MTIPEQDIVFQRMEIFFAENNIMVYDIRRVHEYMNQTVMEKGKIWIWKPLRKKDIRANCNYQIRDYVDWRGNIVDSIYQHIVPMSVLETVVKIAKAFPSAHFFVSDYQDLHPYPFLAVAIPEKPFWVVEFWAEPGFKP